MKMTMRGIVPVAVVMASLVGTAAAQVTGVFASTGAALGAGAGWALGTPPVYQNGVIGPNHYSTVLTGDASILYPGTASVFSTSRFRGWDYFRVQPLPTEISHLKLAGNYKMVNSGGSELFPQATTINYTLQIRQATAFGVVGNPSDPIVMSVSAGGPTLDNNGFLIETFSITSADTPYVLAAGVDYYFQIAVDFTTVIPAHSGSPVYGNSLEFGGPLTSGSFSGFEASFDYRPVPSPGTGAVLVGAGGLLRRRRR